MAAIDILSADMGGLRLDGPCPDTLRQLTRRELSARFSTVEGLNGLLAEHGFPPEPSKTRALAAVKANVFVNLVDMKAGISVNHGSREALRKYTRQTKKYYPLRCAKDEALQPYLQCM